MVSTMPFSEITTPLPARSVPRIEAVNASSGISERTSTTASSACSRSKRQSSGFGRISFGNAQSFCSAMAIGLVLLSDSKAARRVEQMDLRGLRREVHALPRPDAGAAVGHHRQVLAADLHQGLGLGAHRLDHLDLRGDAAFLQREVLGADAIGDALAFLRP